MSREEESRPPHKAEKPQGMMSVETETVDTSTNQILALTQQPAAGTGSGAHSTPLLSPESSSIAANPLSLSGDMHNTLRSKRSMLDPLVDDTESKISSNPNSVRLQKKTGQIKPQTVSTISSNNSSSTQPIKSATRVDFFAARVHDAIKGENSDSDETFVYDNVQTGSVSEPPQPQQQSKQPSISAAVGSSSNLRTENRPRQPPKKDSNDSQSTYSASESFVPSNYTAYGSTTSTELLNSRQKKVSDSLLESEDEHDEYSYRGNSPLMMRGNSSTARSKILAKEKASTSPKSPSNRTYDERAPPQLRAITSKLFDSKGTHPRRYSGIDFTTFNDEDLDGDDDYGFVDDPDEESELEYGTFGKGIDFNATKYGSIGSSYGPFEGDNRSDKHRRMIRRKKAGMYYSPHNFTGARSARLRQLKNFCYTLGLIMLLLSVGFVSGFLLATTKDLQDVKISNIQDIIISQEELVFNVDIQAFNPGFLSIVVSEAEIDVFAQTAFSKVKSVECPDPPNSLPAVPKTEDVDAGLETVLLGTVRSFEMPLVFQGGFFTRQKSESNTEIKLLHPCTPDEGDNDDDDTGNSPPPYDDGDDDGNSGNHIPDKDVSEAGQDSCDISDIPGRKKWSHISKHPFDLIIRGVLTYRLSFSGGNRTVAVNKIVNIDPDKPLRPPVWEIVL